MTLKREVTNLGLLFASISGVIGSGWLFAPFYAAQAAGPGSLISWVIGFVLILILGINFAEVGTLFPVAGGVVRFIKFSHGFPVSFLVGFLNWISFVIIPPIEVQATLQYTAHFWPTLIKNVDGGHPLTATGIGIAAILLAIFMIINSIGIKLVIKLNSSIVWWKLLIPVVAVIALLSSHFHSSNFHSHGFMPMGATGLFSAVTTGGIIFAFIGFRQAIELAGEAKNPHRAIPFALIGSLCIALLLYLLLQVGFIGAIEPKDIAAGWSDIQLIGDSGPFIAIASVIGMIWLVGLLYIDAIISPAGTGLIMTASTARIVYAMTQAGFLPKLFLKTNRFGAPFACILINFVIGLLFFLPFPGWQSMIKYLAGISVIAYSVGPLSLVAFRKQIPTRTRSFKLPMPHLFALLGFIACSLIILWSGWRTVMILDITVGIAFVLMLIYIISKRSRKQPYCLSTHHETLGSLWFLLFMTLISVISYYSHFGGTQQLQDKWSILATIALSTIIYLYAYYSRLSDVLANQYLAQEEASTI